MVALDTFDQLGKPAQEWDGSTGYGANLASPSEEPLFFAPKNAYFICTFIGVLKLRAEQAFVAACPVCFRFGHTSGQLWCSGSLAAPVAAVGTRGVADPSSEYVADNS